MIAARARQLSIIVHAVDDTGALCGARPADRWRESTVIPVNCPSCLRVVAKPRFAVCETPAARSSAQHIRRVGLEGIGGGVGTSTLCGAVAGWDVKQLDPAKTEYGFCPACIAALRREKIKLAS